ncbi:MAG: cytochrome b [Alcanivorax sp.]
MNNKYPKTLRLIHWLMVLLITLQFAVGFFMDDDNLWQIQTHLILGISILAITILRIGIKRAQKDQLPAKPDSLSDKEWGIAKIGHALIYLMLLITPISGLVGYYTHNHDILEVHETLIWGLLVLIVGHVAMVPIHKIRHHQNLMTRMT